MTRYPRGKKGGKWTIKELDAVKAEWKGDTLNDGGGLSGEVRVNSENVSIVFRCAFKWQGKVTWHYCGTYPTRDMTAIREERDKVRIPRTFGHPVHGNPATDSMSIRPPIPR